MTKVRLAGSLLLLLTAACSGESGDSGRQPSKFMPTLNVSMSIEGHDATLKVDTDLRMSPEHYGGARKSGEGHVHLYLNDGEKQSMTDNVIVLEDLPSGEHTVKVSLHNNDHTPYDVTQTIVFDIP